jgi:hypothetical protein
MAAGPAGDAMTCHAMPDRDMSLARRHPWLAKDAEGEWPKSGFPSSWQWNFHSLSKKVWKVFLCQSARAASGSGRSPLLPFPWAVYSITRMIYSRRKQYIVTYAWAKSNCYR